MPRGLFARRSADDGPWTADPDARTPEFGGFSSQLQPSKGVATHNDSLHPYVSTLGLADLESCVALENAAFPENERVCVPFLFPLLKLESASSSALLGPLRDIVAVVVVADNMC